jgi:outer membrane autotransporter protein
MLNGYCELSNLQNFKPYIMAGVGMAPNKAGLTKQVGSYAIGNQKNNFAWQLGVGATYKVTKQSFFDIGYRYVDLGNCSVKATTVRMTVNNSVVGTANIKRPLKVHELSMGIIYKF